MHRLYPTVLHRGQAGGRQHVAPADSGDGSSVIEKVHVCCGAVHLPSFQRHLGGG